MDSLHTAIYVTAFLILMLVPGLYGLHLVALAILAGMRRKGRRRACQDTISHYQTKTPDDQWPIVTTQLPLYNELAVARRVILAAARMEYPEGRHEIQVLDDSTDETVEIVDKLCSELRAEGVDVKVVRRPTRKDFKAGALAYGLEHARGELIAVFDADFVPDPGFLRRMVPLLASDEQACCVQGRWGHLNQTENWITQSLALAMDGHFAIEQGARAWNGFCLNFNGTGGIWRRAAIDDPAVGGWSGDTITEDLDLSYRAQMAGWRILYNDEEECPAEIPANVDAVKTQQRRWATGSMQCARKLLPVIWRSRLSLLQKIEATIHTTHYSIAIYMLLMALFGQFLLLGIPEQVKLTWLVPVWSVLPIIILAPSAAYVYGRGALGGGWSGLGQIVKLIVLGLGLCVNNAYAVAVGLFQRGGEFIRTPKSGSSGVLHRRQQYAAIRSRLWLIELFVGALCVVQWCVLPWTLADRIGGLFLLLYASGLLCFGWASRPWAQGKAAPVVPASTPALETEASRTGVAA